MGAIDACAAKRKELEKRGGGEGGARREEVLYSVSKQLGDYFRRVLSKFSSHLQNKMAPFPIAHSEITSDCLTL